MDVSKNYIVEYKRRFLVNKLPYSLNGYSFENYKYGYINQQNDSLEVECQCNIDLDIHTLNIFDTGTFRRNKIIVQLDDVSASVIMTLATPKIIDVKKYSIKENGVELVLLNIKSLKNELNILEYYGNQDTIRNYKPPQWAGMEITDNFKYSNYGIACGLI